MDNYNIIARRNARSTRNNDSKQWSQIDICVDDSYLTSHNNICSNVNNPYINWNKIAVHAQLAFFVILGIVCIMMTF